PAPTPAGGPFGYLSGSYLFEDVVHGWRLFDVPGDVTTSKESFDDGYAIQGRLGYRWDDWDMAIGGQYADFGEGGVSSAPGFEEQATIGADMWHVDAQAGYNLMLGDTALRAALGVRYAEWHHTVDAGALGGLTHDWWGVGPRLEVNTDTPLAESLSLLFDAGAGILFGEIETEPRRGWTCLDCSDETTTSLNADVRLGLGWTIAPGATLVAGYQAQYWDSVNVESSDTTGQGDNAGDSDHLIHGPFGSFNFDLGK
ncbi:MAG: Lpg1974 family pore-forming outer membrane protein, partial [Parvibaculaceae bacterium]